MGDMMDLAARLAELSKRANEHQEVLATEEAAKTALVMPFIQALGYDVFNPGEVVPEFTADIGTKKGEKVDYAICSNKKVLILIECKPAFTDLNINHAGQLFRYFSVTDARVAILTNGVVYQFFSDVEKPNKMDDKPFFTFSMNALKPNDLKTIEKFAKATFDIEKIVQEAGDLKIQSLIRKELEDELKDPSEEFVSLLAKRVYEGRLTASLRVNFTKLLQVAINAFIRDMVNERLSSALSASNPNEVLSTQDEADLPDADGVMTTDEEITGYRIAQAIAARIVDPKRVIMRDTKSYCGILLDDNNRKPLARLHFNGASVKYIGLFAGKDETRHQISGPTDIYKFASQIEKRLTELENGGDAATVPAAELPASA